MRGVKDPVVIQWDGQGLPTEAGTGSPTTLGPGLRTPVPAGSVRATSGQTRFSFHLRLKGSQGLTFVPVGKVTSVSIRSPWTAPNFRGTYLPERRQIGPSGFRAVWQILDVNRDLPQAWIGERQDLASSASFGVDLPILVDSYRSTIRATKYALLFVFSIFAIFFFMEIFDDRRIHPIQYLLVGCATVVFYLLLLSLSEHVAFPVAYLTASLAVVALIGTYVHGVFGRRRMTTTVIAILSALYAYLYALLQMEDYALLLGSMAMFLALAGIMVATRRVDWYKLEQAHRRPF